MTKFYVSSIDIDDSTPDGRKVKNALSEQSSMSITGHTWQQERAFGMAEQAIGKWWWKQRRWTSGEYYGLEHDEQYAVADG